MITVAYSGKL